MNHRDRVFAEITRMIAEVLGENGLTIDPEDTFLEDLGAASLDLVVLGSRLQEHYGTRVNFAQFLAGLAPGELAGLTVGQLVDHVAASTVSEGIRS